MTGLKQKLNDWIESEQGRMVPIDSIEKQVREWGYKISNYERQLRPSLSPQVQSVKKNGAIIGYMWKPSPNVADFLETWCKPKVVEVEHTLF